MKILALINAVSKLLEACSHFIYPSYCLHCQTLLFQDKKHLCQTCFETLAFLEPEEHCSICFTFKDSSLCEFCLSHPQAFFFDRSAAAFSYDTAASSLVKAIKYGNQAYLSEGLGAMMALQFERLNWPVPDVIVPVPIAWDRRLIRGFNQSQLLAESLSKFLKIPMANVLKRSFGDYSQAGLSHEQREQLKEKNSFYLKGNHQIYDKTILLIDDVMTTSSTINACAKALLEGCPSQIFVLTVCKSV